MLHIRRILQFRLQGKSNREIARELHKSRNNVNEYVKRIESTGKEMAELLKLTDEELSSHLHPSNPPVPADRADPHSGDGCANTIYYCNQKKVVVKVFHKPPVY